MRPKRSSNNYPHHVVAPTDNPYAELEIPPEAHGHVTNTIISRMCVRSSNIYYRGRGTYIYIRKYVLMSSACTCSIYKYTYL